MGKWLTCFSFLPDHPPSPLLHEPDHAAPQQADHPPRAALALVKLFFKKRKYHSKAPSIPKLWPSPLYLNLDRIVFFLDHDFWRRKKTRTESDFGIFNHCNPRGTKWVKWKHAILCYTYLEWENQIWVLASLRILMYLVCSNVQTWCTLLDPPTPQKHSNLDTNTPRVAPTFIILHSRENQSILHPAILSTALAMPVPVS